MAHSTSIPEGEGVGTGTTLDVFVHSEEQEDPALVQIEATALVGTLIKEPGERIWIEQREVELDITLEAAGIRNRHHVHCGRCEFVQVKVRFNGERSHDFRQITTIRTVFDWATGPGAFNLTPEQKAKHVLARPGADHFLDWGVHVGSLVGVGSCEVVLDLLPKERFAG